MPSREESEADQDYRPEYESPLLRGTEIEPRPWDLSDLTRRYLGSSSSCLLDVGCGTAKRLLPLARSAQCIVGVEPNPAMRARARAHIDDAGVANVRIVNAVAEALSFPDESFDVVTCRLAPDDASEIWRVLRPGGWALVEKVGEQDKAALKSFFGSDDEGLRGHYATLAPGERARAHEEAYLALFDEVQVREGQWRTYLDEEGLRLLLENTPIVRGFDIGRDAAAFAQAVRALTTPEGILTIQHRFLILAHKAS
jgi:SAM-dependent methyltransferase